MNGANRRQQFLRQQKRKEQPIEGPERPRFRALYKATQYLYTVAYSANDIENAIENAEDVLIPTEEFEGEREYELMEVENLDTGEIEYM